MAVLCVVILSCLLNIGFQYFDELCRFLRLAGILFVRINDVVSMIFYHFGGQTVDDPASAHRRTQVRPQVLVQTLPPALDATNAGDKLRLVLNRVHVSSRT
jgi:hypothetical protein